jgi:hypothetical protein
MRILQEVRHDIKVADAVRAELLTRNRLLPPRWGDLALIDHVKAISDWFRSLMRRDFEVHSEDILLARKLGRGARPLSLLGLQERILYRGAIALVEAAAQVSSNRGFEEYEAFQQAPLQVQGCRYVLKADIASYYQYIDHERLVDEVVAQTGDDLAVSTATDLLHGATGRAYGLPQLNTSSDVLAEIYIEPMRRALIRSGFVAYRFADDFRVACRTYAEALAAWEAADSAARDLGLVLNESKTSTPGLARYAASLTELHDQEQQLFQDLDVERLDTFPYSETEDEQTQIEITALLAESEFDGGEVTTEPEPGIEIAVPSDAQMTAADRVFDRWLAEEEDEETQRRESAHVTASLLQRALRVFGSAGESSALRHVTSLLVYEPSLTPTISRYLIQCIEEHRSEVTDALNDACESRVMNAWQCAWISYVAGSLPRRRRRRTAETSPPHVEWLKEQSRNSNPALAAESILALARRRLVTIEEVSAVLSRLTSVQRPTGIIALAALGDERVALNAAPTSIDRMRVQWAIEHL